MAHTRRGLKYSRQALRKRLHEASLGNTFDLMLERSQAPEILLSLTSRTDDEGVLCTIRFSISPLSFFREANRAEHLVSFVRALATRLPLSFALGHSATDLSLGTDPQGMDTSTSQSVHEAFWLNVYGPRMVEELGRQRVLSTPAALMEELSGGAILWLTRPTPADFDSEEARVAQARALVHLRPELSLEATLDTLRQRSLAFSPVPIQFDPDVADILLRAVDFLGLAERRKNVENFNRYRPPPVSEWLPASQAPASDVDDAKAAIDTYEGLYAEQLIALFHTEEPSLMESSLEALPRVDFRLWHFRWAKNLSEEQRETLVAALGAWLGRHLVHFLGGRWVPRRKLEESAVIIGDRAWLPFLRARHALQSPESALDSSCSQFFRTAQRLAKPQAH
ncbi:hypothetical protein [Hyalangium rubrum]|uniref:Uncharacterized protein n=1 Tax=Hyalangium rubrum TaxID=3103134 RepID=A0ABU5HAG8_9BACT|nr:hypothetical protein [Hyalangium sp. s54d21]MDY7230477.1 hypothetical protein [Hyalangium sp. s54d21]